MASRVPHPLVSKKPDSLKDTKVWSRGVRVLKKRDRTLGRIIAKVGPYGRFDTYSDRYGALVESMIYQQLAGRAAQAILNKFKALYDNRIPEPNEFLRTSEKKVRSSGISPQKYSYIKDLCLRLQKGVLELERLHALPNEEVIEKLDEVRGIGRWTAEMFLIFSLARTDVLPKDDLGIRSAIKDAYGLRRLPSRRKLGELERKWHPYNSIASLYLWRSHD